MHRDLPNDTKRAMHHTQIRSFRSRLLAWYRRNARTFPWRTNPTLYRTLVAEFMLQQTRADQALPYYRKFLKTLPTMRKLSEARPQTVLKLWEGLGYYRRANQLQRTARHLASQRPVMLKHLEGCPGVGAYTFAAIGSIVFGEPLPVVDGNVRRVMSRILALAVRPESTEGDKIIRTSLDRMISVRAPATWNQAIMELGARVCVPRNPKCGECPVRSWCKAFAQGKVSTYPIRSARTKGLHRNISAAVIRRKDGRVLIAQRLSTGLLPNLWEFPGGKQEKGESLRSCCKREIIEELDIDIEVGRRIAKIDHAYSHYSITLHVFECRYLQGTPKKIGCQNFRWIHVGALDAYPFPRANLPVIQMLTAT